MGNRLVKSFLPILFGFQWFLCAQTVTLEWDPNRDPVVGYNLYRSTRSGGEYLRVNAAPIVTTRFTDTTIQYDVRYYYVCRAIGVAGLESGPSNEVSALRPRPNSPPIANTVSVSTFVGLPTTIAVTANDTDPDGDPLTVTGATQPANGTVSIVSASSVRYSPAAGFLGTDRFTYTISDGRGGSASAQVTVTVIGGANNPPTAVDDRAVTVAGRAVTINVLANDFDPDGDHLELVGHSAPSSGAAQVIGHGLIRYVPHAGFVGIDSLTYSITDGWAVAQARAVVEVLAEGGDFPSQFFPTTVATGSDLLRDTFVGLGFLNPRSQPDGIELTALVESGRALDGGSVLQTLPPGGQTAFLTDELVSPGLGSTHVSARGLVAGVQSFFMIGDYGLHRMDGVGALLIDGVDLVVPEVRESAIETTLMMAVNPSKEGPARVDIELVEASGRVLARVNRIVPPLGIVRDSIRGFFGTDLAGREGYLRLRSDRPVQGFAIAADRESIVTASARPPRSVDRLLAPHFFAGGKGSILKLVNAGDRPATVRIWAYGDSGEAIGAHFVTLPARGFRSVGSEVLTPVAAGEMVTGYLIVETAEAAPIVATMTFRGREGRARTLIPLTEGGLREILFPHLAQTADGSIFTGLALLNPGSTSATVIVEAYDAQGNRTEWKRVIVGPRSRRADLLRSATFFGPSFEQVGGHLRISSNVPVAAYLTFGDSAGEFLSAVEGQEPIR